MATLESIAAADADLTRRYRDRLVVNPDLDRTLVSFQANKASNGYRWFKYKEGFSARLVHYLLEALGVKGGRLLDPFAGSGAALFAAGSAGLDALGIELLPVGCEAIRARKAAREADPAALVRAVEHWLQRRPWERGDGATAFSHLRITRGAFPRETEAVLGRYLAAAARWPDEAARVLLRFAALCVLEEVSYTRKDGQYLRWDCRCGRRPAAKVYTKGSLPPFGDAVARKLAQMRDDLRAPAAVTAAGPAPGEVTFRCGSALDLLPTLNAASFDCLLTSPPYCNRYDYTRTYALELAFLGVGEERLRVLRQAMLACTVENRQKDGLEARFGRVAFTRARRRFEGQELLAQILHYLEVQKEAGLLNNPGIPRMVRNYFWEMALVIAACARVLKPGAPLAMVNDNVRYQGADIPVDLILSDIAAGLGFEVETIWVLPVGKGNSSQQMGRHGRRELRKCVYVWRARACSDDS
jgi:DNA modification methylase